jgi:hypothetical protein
MACYGDTYNGKFEQDLTHLHLPQLKISSLGKPALEKRSQFLPLFLIYEFLGSGFTSN